MDSLGDDFPTFQQFQQMLRGYEYQQRCAAQQAELAFMASTAQQAAYAAYSANSANATNAYNQQFNAYRYGPR